MYVHMQEYVVCYRLTFAQYYIITVIIVGTNNTERMCSIQALIIIM